MGPLVISELNYNPGEPSQNALSFDPNLTEDDLEFVEVHNPTNQSVTLTDWRLRGGVDYDFANEMTLSANSTMIVVSFNPEIAGNSQLLAAFRAQYGIDASVRIVGGWSGQLSDSGEEVRLLRPNSSRVEDPEIVSRVLEDAVLYDDLAPWPAAADGQGNSLVRGVPTSFGSDVGAWTTATPTPGSVDFSGVVVGDLTGDREVTATDIDVLFDAVRRHSDVTLYDLNGDLIVNSGDVTHLVETTLATYFGDANLDGIVNAADLNQVGIHWQQQACNGWSDGDSTGDGAVTAADLNQVGINWQRTPDPVAARRVPRAPLSQRAVVASTADAVSTAQRAGQLETLDHFFATLWNVI